MEPAAARESMLLLYSIQAGCRPMAQAQYSTMPPVVEPMVWGRQRAFPSMGLLYRSGLFWSPQVAFLSPNCNAFWKEARVFRPPWDTRAGAVTVPGAMTRPLNSRMVTFLLR